MPITKRKSILQEEITIMLITNHSGEGSLHLKAVMETLITLSNAEVVEILLNINSDELMSGYSQSIPQNLPILLRNQTFSNLIFKYNQRSALFPEPSCLFNPYYIIIIINQNQHQHSTYLLLDYISFLPPSLP